MKHTVRTAIHSSILLIGAALPVLADVAVTNPDTAPTEGIVLQQVPAGDFHFNYSWNENYEIGQSFLATDDLSITGITIPITLAPGAALKPFLLKVHEVASINEPPSEDNVINTQSGTLPDVITDDKFLTFTPDEPISLSKGKYYIFMFVSTTPESAVNLPLRGTNSFADDAFTWYKDEGDYARYENRSLTIYLTGKKSDAK